ncbi:capsule assembly Wzi family protein [Dyadobacter diqingensis]|uniref:capsule assembly Wzi family protein n=1 Tax=Dyadobacter diqingensis TaxID=2938121 RepID=UPI0020C18C38|nr:capsule assembly Wzi family protein [Dyadobacter diqingensis]
MNQRFDKFLIYVCFILITSSYAQAQSAFVPINDDYYHLIDRLEIKRGKFSEGFHSNVKPFERKAIVALTDSILKEGNVSLTDRDWQTIDYLREDSWEWTKGFAATDSARYARLSRLDPGNKFGLFKGRKRNGQRKFWQHAADFYSFHDKDFDLHLNFTTNDFIGKDNNISSPLWLTGRGIEIRGMINEKLGFYTFVSDNQGVFPKYVTDYAGRYNFPGEGLAKKIQNDKGVDFLSARGYITFRPLKSINVKFGHDVNVFGSGYRSLLLSDNSSPYLFLRIDTQLGRFKYTNLWTSMVNEQQSKDLLRSKKFSAIHHLSINLTDRINIGVFEAEVFSRDSTSGGYDLNYLNPIIFYRYVESYIGSQDNALLGFDFKWLVGKKGSIYSQFVLDEFLTKHMFNGDGSWTNKYSFQLGGKYVDAFGVPNLDLQLETNIVRPYTYAHKDGGRNYVHYNQALAHPLGANFKEYIGILRYKVTPRLSIYGTQTFAKQGLDPTGAWTNYGSNILLDYDTRTGVDPKDNDYGHKIGQGIVAKTSFTDLRLTYSLAHNLFLDARYLHRNTKSVDVKVAQKTDVFSFAIRYNMAYRNQTF